jgi:regulator of nucleoside diphosphate kinase
LRDNFTSVTGVWHICERARSRSQIVFGSERGRARRKEIVMAAKLLNSETVAKGKIYITEFDQKRLKGLINYARKAWDKRAVQHLDDLDEELERAEVVTPEEVPADVITMNSTFRLKDLETGEGVVYTLVFPGKTEFSNGKISVLAPVGIAVLGYRVGDIVEWQVPAGFKRFKVEGILYQPEAALDYHS